MRIGRPPSPTSPQQTRRGSDVEGVGAFGGERDGGDGEERGKRNGWLRIGRGGEVGLKKNGGSDRGSAQIGRYGPEPIDPCPISNPTQLDFSNCISMGYGSQIVLSPLKRGHLMRKEKNMKKNNKLIEGQSLFPSPSPIFSLGLCALLLPPFCLPVHRAPS